MRLSSSIIHAMPSQFKALSAFAAVQTLEEVRGVWNSTQRVLDHMGISVDDVRPAPTTDSGLPDFKRRINYLVQPRLSQSIADIFGEPTNHIPYLLKEIGVESVRTLKDEGMIDEGAAMLWESSAKLYANLGSQMEIVYQFISAGETVSDELIRQAKLVFVFNNADTSVLNMQQGIALEAKFTYQTALKNMIKPKFEARITQAIERCTNISELKRDHGITEEMLERHIDLGIISNYMLTKARQKLKSKSFFQGLSKLWRRKKGG
jgi:hypothetical protein